MKKTVLMTTLALLGGASNAAPGFVYAKFTGKSYDGTSSIWDASGVSVVSSPSMLYAETTEERTTYAYGAYMFLEKDVAYEFYASYDDFSSIRLDGKDVVPMSSSECQEGRGFVAFDQNAWHLVELRGANNGGGGGVNSYLNACERKGFWYRKLPDGPWKRFQNESTDVVFKTELSSGDNTSCGVSAVAWGEPGFRMFTLPGAYDGSTSLWSDGNVLRTIYPDKIYLPVGSIPEHTTYAYGAYMFMEGGVRYTFRAHYDDHATVKIDKAMVIGKSDSECTDRTGSIQFAVDGWHRIELRVSNNGGDGGAMGDVGIVYWTSKDTVRRKMTDFGTGNVFRVGPEPATFVEYTGGCAVAVESISMRKNDPTIMDVEYYGQSSADKVNVRMIAFKDGVRSFANVLRPETFVEGTETNIGDNVSIKGHHKVSWRVSSDWEIDLAKVNVEFLVQDGSGLIPLNFVTIPATANRKAMKVSTNEPSKEKMFNALLWLYANNDPELRLLNGTLYWKNSIPVAQGDHLHYGCTYQYCNNGQNCSWNSTKCIFTKMGYGLLEGENLTYARNALRKELPTLVRNSSGTHNHYDTSKQYAYKEIDN